MEKKLKKITQKQLDKIVKKHQHWLNEDCKDFHTMRADFSDLDCSTLNFSYTNLRKAIFRGAKLDYAVFECACINDADFSNASLENTDFRNTKANYTNFYKANLHCAMFGNSSLVNAMFESAILKNAEMQYANLGVVNFSDADLSYVNFSHSHIQFAIFDNAIIHYVNFAFATIIESDLEAAKITGDIEFSKVNAIFNRIDEKARLGEILKEPLIGYKKTREGKIITLEIPKGAIVFSINNEKCRTNKAKVIDMDGEEVLTSCYDRKFKYHLYDEIEIENFDLRYNLECGTGIHFFKTKEQAKEYSTF